MIIESLLTLISNFISFILNLLPNLPSVPDKIYNSVNGFINLIFSYCGLLGVFVDLDLIKTLIPLLIIVINFEYIYRLVLWVIRKIPFLNIN